MLKIVVDFFIDAASKNEFLDVMHEVIDQTLEVDGCISLVLHEDARDQNHLLLFETWTDSEAVEDYNQTVAFKEAIGRLAAFCTKEIVANIYHQISR